MNRWHLARLVARVDATFVVHDGLHVCAGVTSAFMWRNTKPVISNRMACQALLEFVLRSAAVRVGVHAR
jgi:dihydroorotase-like cyclic amidohydrolase